MGVTAFSVDLPRVDGLLSNLSYLLPLCWSLGFCGVPPHPLGNAYWCFWVSVFSVSKSGTDGYKNKTYNPGIAPQVPGFLTDLSSSLCLPEKILWFENITHIGFLYLIEIKGGTSSLFSQKSKSIVVIIYCQPFKVLQLDGFPECP